jgi:hypothetical protein
VQGCSHAALGIEYQYLLNGNCWPNFPVRGSAWVRLYPGHERQVTAQSRTFSFFLYNNQTFLTDTGHPLVRGEF